MKKVTLVLVVLALSMTLQAAVTVTTHEMDQGGISAWTDFSTGSVIWSSWDDPNSGVRMSSSAAEGFDRSPNGTDEDEQPIVYAHKMEAQTFTASANATLAAVAFNYRGGGTQGAQFTVKIYDITPTASNAVSYTPGAAFPLVLSGTFAQPAGIGGSRLLLLTFDDALALTAGSVYAVELQQVNDDAFLGTGMYVVRGGGNDPQTADGGAAYNVGSTQDGNGNGVFGAQDLYEARNILASWASPTFRDFSFAAYATPEPATICMLGLGGLALLRKRS